MRTKSSTFRVSSPGRSIKAFSRVIKGLPPPVIIPPPEPPEVDFGGYRPHWQGYGTGAVNSSPILSFQQGGRGGTIYLVNTLADNNDSPVLVSPGIFRCSFRRACLESGPRFVLFEVSGVINLNSELLIDNPFITIAAQTAPSPGINIRGTGQFRPHTHDIIVQHLRYRWALGQGSPNDASAAPIWCGEGGGEAQWMYNIIFDHCSVAFANSYMSIGFSDPSGTNPNPWDIALLDCLIAYPLAIAALDGGYGALFGSQANANKTMARCLTVHASHRVPGIMGVGKNQIINCIVWGSGPDDSWRTFPSGGISSGFLDTDPVNNTQFVFVNNKFIPSLGTGSGITIGTNSNHKTFNVNFNSDNVLVRLDKIWLEGNEGPFITGPTVAGQFDGIYWDPSDGGEEFTIAQIAHPTKPSWHTDQNFVEIPTNLMPAIVLANVGARPLDRDAVDVVAIISATAGVNGDVGNYGSRISNPTDLGVPLTLTNNSRPLTICSNPHDLGDAFGRTRIELTLEGTNYFDGTIGIGAREYESWWGV